VNWHDQEGITIRSPVRYGNVIIDG